MTVNTVNLTAGLPVSKVLITDPGDDTTAYMSAGLPAPTSQAYSYPARNTVFANGVQVKLPAYGQYFIGNGLLSAGQAPYDWPEYKHQLHYRKTALALPMADVVPAVARSFSATSYISCETLGSFNLWPTTFAFWIRPHDTGTTAVAVSFSKDNLQYSYFRIGSAGSSRFYQRNTAGAYAAVSNPPQDEWSLVVCRAASETDTRLWINGATGSSSANKGSGGSYNPYAICGGHYNGSAYSSDFDGDISHTAFWNTVLTDAEIASLYNNGIGLDPRNVRRESLVAYWPLTGNDNDLVGDYHLTPYNNPTWAGGPFELDQSDNPIPYFTRRLTPSRRRTYIPLPMGGAL